ncbi:MAG: tetratricopeptide repeat protein [Rhodocyclaceae bacterium]|nr:tetratricopeptide repeat protein [Rhodocyclaceae bacterium]
MSLLLDALQRASEEKEKLADARAAANDVAQSEASVPQISSSPAFADLSLALESSLQLVEDVVTTPTVVVGPSLDALENAEVAIKPALSISPIALTPPADPPPPPAAPAIEQPTQAAPKEVQAISVATPSVSSTKMAESAKPVTQPHPSPTASSKVAREILDATAKKAKPPFIRRPVVLGLIAFIALAQGAYFLGFMDSVFGTAGSPVSSIAPIAAPDTAINATAPQPPATGTEPMLAADVSSPVGAGDTPLNARAVPSVAIAGAVANSAIAKSAIARPTAKTSAAVAAKAPVPIFTTTPAPETNLDAAYRALLDGRLDEAARDYRKALDKNPDERDALLGLAYIAQRTDQHDDARIGYERVLRLEPGHPGATSGLLTLATKSDPQMTATRAREMVERNPESAVALSTLGGLLAREGRIAEAQQVYFKALSLEPDNALYAYNLAVALDRMHKYQQAQGYYQRALMLAEKSATIDRAGFPTAEAQQRLLQLRERNGGS